MSDDLRRRIQSVTPPGELDAERRTWAVVRAAWEEREPVSRAWRPGRLVTAVALAAAAVAAVAVTPAGPAVVDAVRDAFGSDDAEPGLDSLPASGRLLVVSEEGVWVVRGDGSKRRLGDYDAASWSPAGRFVVATDERHVVAVEPDTGDVRWSLTRPDVADARWMPGSGTRVAYRSGRGLRVVEGDGSDDARVARRVRPVAPAWRLGVENELAFAAGSSVVLRDVGADRVLWQRRLGRVAALAWSADGARLAVVGPRRVVFVSAAGRRLGGARLPRGSEPVAAAYSTRGRTLAVLVRGRDASEVVLLRPRGRTRVLTRSPGRLAGLAWSPDGRFVLVGWESADEWLFLPVRGGEPTAVGEIAAEFAPGGGEPSYPRIEGWVSTP